MLTQKQKARFHALVVKEAVGDITPKQLAELETLDSKRDYQPAPEPIRPPRPATKIVVGQF